MLLNPIYNEFNYICICLQLHYIYFFYNSPGTQQHLWGDWVDSPMDENIQPELPHNRKSLENVTMEHTDFVQNEANYSHANI